ncbi:hypothetical protein D9758_017149 [Tetrapyrgos nigripes]|uniref:F-box domain-containing protein n=1 Tax=Tetrapyrgos nigripes TaxID=182062 RepID=A0A8H5F9T9_9AGAR|nr:hypothetical protein D9758_017149 [Tetrapyrgos nigripes]
MLSTTLCQKCNNTFTAADRTPLSASSLSMQQLRTRQTLSDTDISRMQHLVENAERDLERYDTEIGALTEILNKLQEERKTLQRYTDEHRSLLAPVRRLPVELISEIFAFATCPDGLTIGQGYIDTPTLAFSQTCNVWKNIVYSRPALWSCWDIDLGNSTPRTISLLQQYLDRSGDAPLTFKISATDIDDEDALDELHKDGWNMLEIILSHRLQWKEATFNLHWDIYTEGYYRMRSSIPRQTDRPLDSLEVLNIHWTCDSMVLDPDADSDSDPNKKTFFHLFPGWPALRSLSLDAFHPFLPFPFEKLQELKICDNCADGSPGDIFELCGGLEHLSLRTGDQYLGDFDDLNVTHKSLQSLELYVGDEYAAIGLFEGLTVPCLTTLKVSGTIVDQEEDWQRSFRAMLARSKCPLELFEFHEGFFRSDEEVLAVLKLLPRLKCLKMDLGSGFQNFFTDTLVLNLTIEDGSNSVTGPVSLLLLPSLTHLEVSLGDFWPFHDWTRWKVAYDNERFLPKPDLVIAMLRSRKSRSSTPVCRSSSESSERRLQAWTDDHNTVVGLEKLKLSANFRTPAGRDWFSLTIPGLRVLKQEGLGLDVEFRAQDTELFRL